VTTSANEEPDGSPSPATNEEPGQKSTPEKPRDFRTFVSAQWRVMVAGGVELAGIGVLSAGFWLIRPWAGLIVLGVGLIAVGVASSPRFDRRRVP
jgi:hypothetical protein